MSMDSDRPRATSKRLNNNQEEDILPPPPPGKNNSSYSRAQSIWICKSHSPFNKEERITYSLPFKSFSFAVRDELPFNLMLPDCEDGSYLNDDNDDDDDHYYSSDSDIELDLFAPEEGKNKKILVNKFYPQRELENDRLNIPGTKKTMCTNRFRSSVLQETETVSNSKSMGKEELVQMIPIQVPPKKLSRAQSYRVSHPGLPTSPTDVRSRSLSAPAEVLKERVHRMMCSTTPSI
eukprot:scaffold1498_cov180-Ochromonas_danica.AAC.11